MAAQDLTLRTSEIYGWICPATGDVVYIGKTATGIKPRMVCHRGKARRRPRLPSEFWMRTQLDQGIHVEAIILEQCSVADSAEVEMAWIAHFGLENLLNLRVGGNGNPGTVRTKWTAPLIALLGTMSDQELAKIIGCTKSAVNYKRRMLGIEPRKQPPPPTKVTLPLDILARLGTMPDWALGKEIGVCKFVIATNRRARGIPSFAAETGCDGRIKAGDPHRHWELMPAWAAALLGIEKDYLLAERLGWSVRRVAKHRREAGLRPNRAKKFERSDLAGVPRKKRADAGFSRGANAKSRIPSQIGVPAGEEGPI